VRVISCIIVLALLCLTGNGCSLFKKNNSSTSGPGNNSSASLPKFPPAQDPLVNSTIPPPPSFTPTTPPSGTIPTSANKTIIAGTVTDAYHRPIGNAYIRPIKLPEKEAGAPIDVAADANGHFIIHGLTPGADYTLIARVKQGDKMLAGKVLTSAPNPRVVIEIREDFANSGTPPVPSSPAYQGPKDTKEESSRNANPSPYGNNWNTGQPTKPVPKAPGAEPSLPAMMNVQGPPAAGGNPTYVPGVVDNQKDKGSLPLLKIPGNKPRTTPSPDLPHDPPRPPAWAPGDSKLDTGPTRVPSCVLVGTHLENMALRDSKGQVWEYRKHGHGKLLLIAGS
jgi:hypothetical protein